MPVPNLLQTAFPHAWKRAAGVWLNKWHCPHSGHPSPTAHLTIIISWYDTENWQSPVHYSEDIGLIPLCLRNGSEATPPMHQHPRAPSPHPCPQLRSSTSEGIRRHLFPATSFAVLGTELRLLIASGYAATSREKPASQLLLRGEDMFCSQPAQRSPGRALRVSSTLRRQEVGSRITIPVGQLQPGLLFYSQSWRRDGRVRLPATTKIKNGHVGKSEGLREKESFNLSLDPEEMSETEAEIVIQQGGK